MKTNEPSVFICAAFHIYMKGRSKTIPRYVSTASRNILIFQINIRIMLKQLSIVTLISLRQVYKYIHVHFIFCQIMGRMMNLDNVFNSKWKANLKDITRTKFYYTY